MCCLYKVRQNKNFICLFFSLFVFLVFFLVSLFVVIKPENSYFVFRPEREVKFLGVYPPRPHSYSWRSHQKYNTTRRHSTCQLRLILYKLTNWLASESLDLHKPYTSHILSHQNQNPQNSVPQCHVCHDPLKHTNTQDSQNELKGGGGTPWTIGS